MSNMYNYNIFYTCWLVYVAIINDAKVCSTSDVKYWKKNN